MSSQIILVAVILIFLCFLTNQSERQFKNSEVFRQKRKVNSPKLNPPSATKIVEYIRVRDFNENLKSNSD